MEMQVIPIEVELTIYLLLGFMGLVSLRATKFCSMIAGLFLCKLVLTPLLLFAYLTASTAGTGSLLTFPSVVLLIYFVMLSVVLANYSAVAAHRYLVRLSPLRVSVEHPRPHGIASNTVILVLFIRFIMVMFILPAKSIDIYVNHQNLILLHMVMAGYSIFDGLVVLYTIKKWDMEVVFNDRTFILFLRRFSGFADKSVVLGVLRAAPTGIPVVFFVSPESDPGIWDPILIGFSGMRMLQSYKSSPLYISAPVEDWEAGVTRLIRHASCIVVDVSDMSTGVQRELELVRLAQKQEQTILLQNKSMESTATSLPDYLRNSSILSYETSWSAAMPRMLLGIPTTLGIPFSIFVMIGMLIRGIPWDMEMIIRLFKLWALPMYPLAIIVTFLFYFVFFCRPVMSASAYRELKRRIRAAI